MDDELTNFLNEMPPEPVVEKEPIDPIVEKKEAKPKPKPKPKEPKEFVPSYLIEEHDIDYMRIAKHFGLDINDLNIYQEKLDTIIRWAKEQTKSQDITDIMLRVKALQRELGTDPAGKPFEDIYRFVVLDNDEKQIQKEKQLLK